MIHRADPRRNDKDPRLRFNAADLCRRWGRIRSIPTGFGRSVWSAAGDPPAGAKSKVYWGIDRGGRERVQLGVNTVLFSKFDFATAARAIAQCGYDGLEVAAIRGMCEHLVLDHWEDQVDGVRAILQETGLRALSMEVADPTDAERVNQACAAAAALGIPVVNVGPGVKAGIPGGMEQCIDLLRRDVALAERHGVCLCVKAHVGTVISDTPSTLAALAAIPSPAFGVDMDPSHIHRAGEDPVVALRQVVSRVRHIHIRDCQGRESGPGPVERQACGRGDIDLWGYMTVLHDAGYTGPVCLEVIGATPQHDLKSVVAVAAESYGYLNAIARRIGFR